VARQPDPWRSLWAEIRAIKEQLRRLHNSSAFARSGMSVTDPGQVVQSGSVTIPTDGLLLVDGGDVVLRNDAGVDVLRIGVQEFGDVGLRIRREDGSTALQMRKLFTPGDTLQVFQVLDRDGNVIAGDAGLSTAGFDAPHIPLAFIPTNYDSSTNAQTISSGTFAATHEHRGFKQNPFFRPQFMVKCSDGTTAGEIQLYDVVGAGYLIGFFTGVRKATIPVGTTTYTLFELDGAVMLPGVMSDALHIEVHVRRTAGAGSITVAPVRTVAGQVNV
jgi:hypothetical protein